MSITDANIKLIKSQVMDDVPEGGGAPVSATIDDGVSNAIFPDISELDRAGGRVNLRKVFAGVRTSDVDGYYGVNVIVAEPPQDPRVSITMFPTNDMFDRRIDAQDRMESYLAKGAMYSGFLFGDHIAGQASVTLLQRNEVPLPVIGQTLMLRKNEGLSNETDQYVRITDVGSSVRTFTDASGDFQRTQVVLSISDVLNHDFPGFEALRYDSSINYTGKTKTFDTIVADAARYYGVVELKEDASIGDYLVEADGIFTQLVPSTRIEVPIADSRMNQQSATLVKAGDSYARSITLAFTTSQALYVGGSILPGSLSVSRGGVTITDKGGSLVDSTSSVIGTIDYSNGVLTLSSNVFGTSAGAHNVVYTPATAPTIINESISQPVTIEAQRLSWVQTIDPPPARGSLQVSYRAQGQWYTLSEDGSGVIRGGDSSLGAGTINFTTGTVSITLGALPDVGSAVVFTYAASVLSRPLDQVAAVGPALGRAFGKPLSVGSTIKPGTVTITWNDGSARSATDSGGVLIGDATGMVNYAEGIIDFRPTALPAKNTSISVSITEATPQKGHVTSFTDGGSNWTCTLPAPLKARTVELAVVGLYNDDMYSGAQNKLTSIRLFDDGAGNLMMANIDANATVGTINYSTGAVSIPKSFSGFKVEGPAYAKSLIPSGGGFAAYGVKQTGYQVKSVTLNFLNGPGIESPSVPVWSWWGGPQGNALEMRYAGVDGSADSQSIAFDSIFLPSNPNGFASPSGYSEKLVSFFLGSSLYVLNPVDNTWQRNPSPTTGLGTAAGASAILGGVTGVLITDWTAGTSSTPTGVVGATNPDTSGVTSLMVVDAASFRTAVAPLVNGGFSIAGNWSRTGGGFTANADSNGVINSGSAPVGETPGSYGVFGRVDYEMGLVEVRFGRRIPASMEALADVIDVAQLGIAGVSKIQSYPAQSDTLRYNAVGYSYLPLDPDILGMNPVRLPPDGRVPIFRPGSFAVVGHKGVVGPASVSNGQTINCGRVRLSRIRVIGDDGVVITTGYTKDLDAGTITFDNVSGYDQPVTVEHYIEDMALVRSVQITGQISLTRPLTHDYPAPGSYISSALVAGDVRARTSLVFDQSTWNNTWSDAVVGSPATGTFDDAHNPITVTNSGALTERWACVFTSSTGFNVIGEHVGVIATGTIGSNCAPMNPSTGQPYFTIPATGWGAGWSTGNVMRFNTVGALVPIWVARTILQGPETVPDDSWTMLIRGDVDHP